MRRLAPLILICLAAPLIAQDGTPPPEERVFLEISSDCSTCFVQQPFRLILRVGFDREFAESNLVPLFSRRMDLKAQVRAPWLAGFPGARILTDGAGFGMETGENEARDRLSLAVNDDVEEALRIEDRTIDGRDFTVIELTRIYLPTVPGEIRIPAPTLRFAYATEFVGDFINGKRPRDRKDVVVTGEPHTVTILPLPDEGRPANFTGAVGTFTVRAEADLEEVEVEDSIQLTLTIEGQGNLATFDTPDLGELPGFHALGAIDDHAAGRRTVVYDLVVLGPGLTAIPAISFPFFDPQAPAGFRAARTEPIPLTVHGDASPLPVDPEPTASEDESRWLLVPAALVAVVLLTVMIVVFLRRSSNETEKINPEEQRALNAAAVFRSAVREPGVDLAAAFAEYLAAHLKCAPAKVISPELQSRLEAVGIPEDPAGRTAKLLESLVAMNYGGTLSPEAAAASAIEMVGELEKVETSD